MWSKSRQKPPLHNTIFPCTNVHSGEDISLLEKASLSVYILIVARLYFQRHLAQGSYQFWKIFPWVFTINSKLFSMAFVCLFTWMYFLWLRIIIYNNRNSDSLFWRMLSCCSECTISLTELKRHCLLCYYSFLPVCAQTGIEKW